MLAAGIVLAATAGSAAELSVSPILIEVAAPGAAGSLTIRDGGKRNVVVQVRVFEWTQKNGQDVLTPTDKVVASPPMIKLTPDKDFVVRVVRVDKRPVAGVENFRLVLDQLPEPPRQDGTNVNLLIRQSIPVFFMAEAYAPFQLEWSLQTRDGRAVLVAANRGDDRARIVDLLLLTKGGQEVFAGHGLAGYALGHSSIEWMLPSGAAKLLEKKGATMSARTQNGPISAKVQWVAN